MAEFKLPSGRSMVIGRYVLCTARINLSKWLKTSFQTKKWKTKRQLGKKCERLRGIKRVQIGNFSPLPSRFSFYAFYTYVLSSFLFIISTVPHYFFLFYRFFRIFWKIFCKRTIFPLSLLLKGCSEHTLAANFYHFLIPSPT